MVTPLTNLGVNGRRISDKLKSRCNINERKPGQSIFMDMPRLKIGKKLIFESNRDVKKSEL